MFGHLVFYPSLTYNLVRNLVQPDRWRWYSRVNDHLIVGALPFRSMVDELKAENVGGIVCCTEEFETKAAYSGMSGADWLAENVRFHHVPMFDFTGTASRQALHEAVQFVDQVASSGHTTYVHCKAGRTRSATVAVCYLMFKENLDPNSAFDFLQRARPQVMLRSAHWRSVRDYREYLDTVKHEKHK